MLNAFRKFARSWVSAVLIGLLVISFGIWGMNDIFKSGPTDGVAKVAGETISQADYRAEFDRLLKQAKAESKRDITLEDARKEGLDKAVLERMVDERAFAAWTKNLGLMPATSVIQKEISRIPAFQNPITRRFSPESYQTTLSEIGFTAIEFEQKARTDLARQSLFLAASSALKAPRVFASQTLAFGTERRLVTLVPMPASLVGEPHHPTDAQLTSLYNEMRPQLTRPEMRSVTLALASLGDFEAKAKVDEAEVLAQFNRTKDRLSTPAKRTIVQLVAPDRGKADQAAARLRTGEDPAIIAKSLALPAPINMVKVSQTGVTDVNVGQAAFAMSSGEVQVIQAKLQPFAAVKVTEIIPGKEVSFAEAAVEIRAKLRRAAAGELMTDATEAFDKVLSQGGNLEAAAAKSGFKIVKIKDFVADGRSILTGQPVPEFVEAPSLLRDSFSGAQGDTTDLVSIPGEKYAALRIDTITPAAPPPFEAIRVGLVSEWMRRDMRQRAQIKADELLNEAKKTSLESVAAKFKLPLARQNEPLLRGQGGASLSQAVFSAKKGDIIIAPAGNNVEFVLVRIDEILRDEDATVPGRMREAETAVQASIQRDVIASLERVARERAKAELYPKMVGRALGESADATPTSEKTKPPAPVSNKTP
ncbi:peptidylprolyl isomerase [Candidatus Phycosocius spiralis]|uniref:Rotamase n=1 Tax=Candidatus Phycosocius spiralis TaxID=2815099 RepID=A0ABQ4PTC5_9PROT|nr:peptidylprolyl isomerase [Candidatus Phycosocius spiralis]GIU66159.1 rotamase [Candidatus Phycosocius spiralis]